MFRKVVYGLRIVIAGFLIGISMLLSDIKKRLSRKVGYYAWCGRRKDDPLCQNSSECYWSW